MDKLSMEARMLIAMLLVGVVFGVSQYLMPAPAEPPAVGKNKDAKAEQAAVQTAPATGTPPAPAAEAPGQIQAAEATTFMIDTDVHTVVFSNRGGTVRKWILKGYKDSKGQPLDLVNDAALQLTG